MPCLAGAAAAEQLNTYTILIEPLLDINAASTVPAVAVPSTIECDRPMDGSNQWAAATAAARYPSISAPSTMECNRPIDGSNQWRATAPSWGSFAPPPHKVVAPQCTAFVSVVVFLTLRWQLQLNEELYSDLEQGEVARTEKHISTLVAKDEVLKADKMPL